MSFPIEPYNENANEGLNGGLKILLKLIQKKEGIQGKSISEK